MKSVGPATPVKAGASIEILIRLSAEMAKELFP